MSSTQEMRSNGSNYDPRQLLTNSVFSFCLTGIIFKGVNIYKNP